MVGGDPDRAIFHASGRAGLEAIYMFQLFARMHGVNNLPDGYDMGHGSTGVAPPESIGVGIGTVKLGNFEQTDFIIHTGHNIATSAPKIAPMSIRAGGATAGNGRSACAEFSIPHGPQLESPTPRRTRRNSRSWHASASSTLSGSPFS